VKVVVSLADLRIERMGLRGPLGLVPTMGALHAGHASLVSRARDECASVAASIFVNPAQFGPAEDLAKYPRTLEKDLALLESLGTDLVWTPSPSEVYPEGFQSWVSVDEVSRPLEGASRPGHFRGVATVVAKLFLAFGPDRAYFGRKDAQQLAVIRRMARDLAFPIEVVGCPTVREPDGLAMSSRNANLSPAERAAAPVLFRALLAARDANDANDANGGHGGHGAGGRSGGALRAAMRAVLSGEPLAEVLYVSAADPGSLVEVGDLEEAGEDLLLSLAVRIGATRLIDNILLENGRWDTGVPG
jgi:pantoate--beta-alanine ligase